MCIFFTFYILCNLVLWLQKGRKKTGLLLNIYKINIKVINKYGKKNHVKNLYTRVEFFY